MHLCYRVSTAHHQTVLKIAGFSQRSLNLGRRNPHTFYFQITFSTSCKNNIAIISHIPQITHAKSNFFFITSQRDKIPGLQLTIEQITVRQIHTRHIHSPHLINGTWLQLLIQNIISVMCQCFTIRNHINIFSSDFMPYTPDSCFRRTA